MQNFKVGDIIIPTRLNTYSSELCDNNPIDMCKNKPIQILDIGEQRAGFSVYTPMACVDIETGITYGFCLSEDNTFELYTGKIPKKVDIINFDGGF